MISYHLGTGGTLDHDHKGQLSNRIETLQPVINNLEALIQTRLHFEEAD